MDIYQILVFPDFLNGVNEKTILCPKCNSTINSEIKMERRCVLECDTCSYKDRPFGYVRSQYWNEPCTCIWKDVKILYLKCNKCMICKCTKCSSDIVYSEYKNGDFREKICNTCKTEFNMKIQKENELIAKKEFSEKWKTMTIHDKLNLYGIVKLKILAKNKNIKSIYKYNKQSLIEILTPITSNSDFPIK
jgi:hypothetical protein